MNIIIAGAGEVGFHLAKMLSYESHDITLIDNSEQALCYADAHLDILVINGNASSPSVLREARVSTADMVIAVTSSETTNITLCMVAKQLGCKQTIARVSNSEFIADNNGIDFTKMGIDEIISPEYLAAREILMLLDSAFSDTYQFDKGALTMVGTLIDEKSLLTGKSVKEVSQIYNYFEFVTIALKRKETTYTIIPRGDTTYQEGDLVYFMVSKKAVKDLHKLTGKKKNSIKSVMILGGGRIGVKAARALSSSHFKVKVIENNKRRANNLAEKLPKVMVIEGDGSNVELLEEEDFESMDAFIAVTGNSETNIMSCLLAKSRDIKKTIALVENTDYFEISQSVGIDSMINKKIIAAGSIFRHVRRGNVVHVELLNNMEGEILEFVVTEKSKIANNRIRDLEFPRSAIIAGVVRDGKGIIALGDFSIAAGDRVVVCCMQEAIGKVEKLFF